MSFVIFSDIEMNCVLFPKMDQVFSLRKNIKKYFKMGKHTGKVREFCGNRVRTIFRIFFFQHQVRCLGVWCVAMGDCHLGIESVSRDERK